MSELVKRRRRFEDIDSKSWEHPADRAALVAVRQIKGLDEIMKAIFGVTSDRNLRLLYIASSVKVTERQFPKLNAMMNDIVDTFDWPYRPDVFVAQSPFFNAGVLGVDRPFIVVNSSTVSRLDDSEIKAVLAHEMGHIMSGHALYKTVLSILLNLSLDVIPVGRLVILPIILALSEWDRRSELSADRAGLLALQAEEPCYTLLMKSSGGDDLSQMNLNDFFEQAAEYDSSPTVLDSVFKLFNSALLTHPFPVVRLSELRAWSSGGSYSAIMDGIYLRRTLRNDKVDEEVRGAYEYYKSEMQDSDDPLAKVAAAIGPGVEQVAKDLGEGIKKASDAITQSLKDMFSKSG